LIEKYSIEASLVPYNLYLLAERVQIIADDLFVIGNKNVVSDAKIASDLCYAIYPGCVLNIKANMGNIKDLEVLNKLKTVI
jgi:formiminotetrahydrofolate cyclodeaminase